LHHYWEWARECIAIWEQSGSDNREVLSVFARKVLKSKGQALQEKDWVEFLATATPEDTLDA
jgi:hypothetical protein